MTRAIEVNALTKVYGDVRALDGLDLAVEAGSVFGFLGPNGAGKTTALRILTGLAHPTGGKASILGADVVRASNEVRAKIGYLPDVPGFYGWMTAEEFLRFAGRIFGLSGAPLDERVAVLLDLSGLDGVTTKIGGYSRGMKQRLGVAQALVNSPSVLLLDEPTSALDPVGRKDVLDMIAALKGRTTVFFSTHILADVERVCDEVAIIDQGRVLRQASISDLKRERAAARIYLSVTERSSELEAEIRAQSWSGETWLDEARIVFVPTDLDAARAAIPGLLVAGGFSLVEMAEEVPSLEDVFVDLVGGG